MTIELLKLPNVRMHKDMNVSEGNLVVGAKQLAWEVATKHPLWTIEVTGVRNYKALEHNQVIGKFGMEWHGSKMKLYVSNHRIEAQSEHKSSYHTDKVDKAYLKIKKMFAPMNLSERVMAALKVADNVFDNQSYNARRNVNDHIHPVNRSMMKYAETQMAQYILWLKETHQTAVLDSLTLLDKARADMMTIESVKKAFDSKQTALVVLAEGKYIVKVLDNVQLYDDTTLPVELRGKLGMLKLVEKEAMVTGIGCRVNDEIFVLLIDEVKNETEETK